MTQLEKHNGALADSLSLLLSLLVQKSQAPTYEHVPNVAIFYFGLTCDVISDPEVNKIKLYSTILAALSNAV